MTPTKVMSCGDTTKLLPGSGAYGVNQAKGIFDQQLDGALRLNFSQH
jgi:hypothetical protein